MEGAYPPLNVAQGGKIVVIDSIFQNGVQPLDNISWINVQFRGTRPESSGGAIHLRNVSFSVSNEPGMLFMLPPTLANLILNSNGKPIDYDFEPEK